MSPRSEQKTTAGRGIFLSPVGCQLRIELYSTSAPSHLLLAAHLHGEFVFPNVHTQKG